MITLTAFATQVKHAITESHSKTSFREREISEWSFNDECSLAFLLVGNGFPPGPNRGCSASLVLESVEDAILRTVKTSRKKASRMMG